MSRRAMAATLALLACACAHRDADEDAVQALPVKVELAARGAFQATLMLMGVVRPGEVVPLVAMRSGTVRYPPRFATGLQTGDTVRAGEVLATIESEEARHELEIARLQAAHGESEHARTGRAAEEGIVPESERARVEQDVRVAREQLLSAERRAEPLVLRAPRSGSLIVKQPIAAGTLVAGGEDLGEIALDGPRRVEAAVAASDRARLRPGLPARFMLAGTRTTAGSGSVREVASVVDEAGAVRVVVSVAKDVAMPLPGEGVDVEVLLPPLPDALTVPDSAVAVSSAGSAVFVLGQAEGYPPRSVARRVPVELGVRGGGRVEVVRGVEAGDKVIVTSVAFLADGAVVSDMAAKAPPKPMSARGKKK
jgi:RND family efflux transporter MFP subunit